MSRVENHRLRKVSVGLLDVARQLSIDAEKFPSRVPILFGALPMQILVELDGQRVRHNDVLVAAVVEDANIRLVQDGAQPVGGCGEEIGNQIVVDVVDFGKVLIPDVQGSSDVRLRDKLDVHVKVQLVGLQDVVQVGVVAVDQEGVEDSVPVLENEFIF